MADQELVYKIRVDTKTGELSVLENSLKDIEKQTKKTEDSFKSLSEKAGDLLKTLLKLEAGRRFLVFINESINIAEEYNEALRRVKFTLDASGVSWSENSEKIQSWAQRLQETTRFGDDEALNTLGKLIRVTNDLGQAQSATTLAFGIASSTGKDLASTETLLIDLINGNSRALLEARRQFGGLIEGVTSTQEVLDILSKTYQKSASTEQSLTKTKANLINAFSDLRKSLGNDLIPVWEKFLGLLIKTTSVAQEAWEGVRKITTAMSAVAAEAWIKITMKGEEQANALKALWEDLGSKWDELEKKKTQTTIEQEDVRLVTSKDAIEKQKQIELEAEEKLASERLANIQKVLVGQNDAHIKAFEEYKKTKQKEEEIEKKKQAAVLSSTIENLRELGKQSGEAFEAYKALAIAQTIISTYEGAQNAYTSLAKIPIIGPALGSAAAAVALAAGIARVSVIQSQQRPTYHTGGQISGAGEVPITALSGEYVVNRGATARNRGLLESINNGSPSAQGGITVKVYVNFSAQQFSMDNAQFLISSLSSEIAKETTEAVKLAVKMSDVANRNNTMAV